MAPETPKGVSSRLLTMKFMQRAAASSAASSSPEKDGETHSSKKRKLGHAATQNQFNAEIDQASIQAAIDEREAKRQAGLEKHGSAADTHWTLPTNLNEDKAGRSNKKALRIVYVGYGDGDSSDEGWEDDPQAGRTSTGKYKSSDTKDPSKRKRSDGEESGLDSSSEGSSDDNDGNGEDHTKREDGQESSSAAGEKRGRSQSRRHSGRSLKRSIAKEFRDKRKTKEVKLSKLTSISSSGNNITSNSKATKCYACNQMGHRAADCPSRDSGKRQS